MRELTDLEVEQVSGGGVEVNWALFAGGLAMIGLGVAIAGTAGLATVPVGIILGAGTFGEIGVGVVSLGFAGAGGFVSGGAFSSEGGGRRWGIRPRPGTLIRNILTASGLRRRERAPWRASS